MTAARSDVHRQVAVLHAANLDQGFLSTLGVEFLAQMYRAIDEAPGSVLICEQVDAEVVGFIAGTTGMGAIYRRMLRRPFALAFALLPSLLSPRRVFRIVEILRYGGSHDTDAVLPKAELLSIAVAAGHRRGGVAARLYQRLSAHFADAREPAFKITVGNRLQAAHAFYQRMGARAAATIEVHRGESSTVYVHDGLQPGTGG